MGHVSEWRHQGGDNGQFFLTSIIETKHNRDVPAFLRTLEEGKAAVDKIRTGLWDARQPNSELVFPHVNIWNPEPLRRSMNRALLEQVRGSRVTGGL